uniref:Uncharacterized protein n=1 Tax=Latimeria chalumnae TaxID=7897 RepID=H3AGU7_LATCH
SSNEEEDIQDEQEKREVAATIIQRAWRKCIDIHVFKFYKSLINFRLKGDPRLLLRCINPREAELLDAAAGIHVRFRLGGIKFPPNIYYKIYTHRPIVDMCANSPKDYTKFCVKQPLPKQLHNVGKLPKDDYSGWYKRIENNGWRLITNRILKFLDPITTETIEKRTEFHHSRLRRRQEVERKRKRRKIDWMKKMYQKGILEAQTMDLNTAVLIQRATEGMMSAVDHKGPDVVMEWEVDELLEWTNSLNYEEYLNSWKEIATSNKSEEFQGIPYIASLYDPYEFTKLSTVTNKSSLENSTEN